MLIAPFQHAPVPFLVRNSTLHTPFSDTGENRSNPTGEQQSRGHLPVAVVPGRLATSSGGSLVVPTTSSSCGSSGFVVPATSSRSGGGSIVGETTSTVTTGTIIRGDGLLAAL
jgi:hypothetical protein